MDSFAQRMLEKAEQRSKALCISSAPKTPLAERNTENDAPAVVTATTTAKHQSRASNKTPKKDGTLNGGSGSIARFDKHRQSPGQRVSDRNVSVDSKENDLSVEINITTGPNVQVQVEVEEREVDQDGNVLSSTTSRSKALAASANEMLDVATTAAAAIASGTTSAPLIRDSSRNRLQRLGALYSDTENLSSPIHRNESRFDEENIYVRDEALSSPFAKPKNRFAKLADLANSINSWEDESFNSDGNNDVVHANKIFNKPAKATATTKTSTITTSTNKVKNTEPKIVGMCPRKADQGRSTAVVDRRPSASKADGVATAKSSDKIKEKNLRWDPKVMNALESQGFKRRETSNTHLVYDYKNQHEAAVQTAKIAEAKNASAGVNVKKTSTEMASKTAAEQKIEKNPVEVSKGLVSGRTAIFEHSNQSERRLAKLQKDPAEMSLKERLALFEKNKGTALIPKAALGMSVSAKQIAADQKGSKNVDVKKPIISVGGGGGVCGGSHNTSSSNVVPSTSKVQPYNKPVMADSAASGKGIQQTVAALLSNTSTISESQIAADVRKTREEEMNVLLNRFNNKHKSHEQQQQPASALDHRSELLRPSAPPLTPPPPPPPMPKAALFSPNNTLEYSNGGYIDKKKTHKRRSDEKLDANSQVRKSFDDMKRVKVNPPKDGCLYPALSDIESLNTNSDKEIYFSTEEMPAKTKNVRFDHNTHEYSSSIEDDDDDSYMDSEDNASYSSNNLNGSFGREVLNATARPKKIIYLDSSTASSANEGVDMDDYLDEALEDDEENDEDTPKKGSISSNSFCFEKRPKNYQRHHTIHEESAAMVHDDPSNDYRSPVKSKLTASEDDNVVTLTHTVSFYRRQQSQNTNTPVKRVQHGERNDSSTNDDNEDAEDIFSNERYIESQRGLVQNKIKSLLDNVAIQQQQISQASKALNTCASTFEFSGSTESVLAEWKLLVASHNREAALNEITRLKVERCLRLPDAPNECGRLTVREITLPLKQDYITKLSTDTISGHHLVCILKHNEHVLATRTIPTLPGLLAVKFPDVLQLNNVYADFKATLEIYGMAAQREVLPHDIKYHIKNKKGGIKTPKGKKAAESQFVMPFAQSPAGPMAVRSTSFTNYGFIIFSLREIQRTSWTLNEVSGVSPLVGNVYMKVNCELSVNIDYKGFLTMFEDISGFGAWHRRWCRLHGNTLSYWKYPDDERKPPIGTLDLSTCEQQKINTAPRDVCARLNTLLLELKRPSYPDDRDSLVTVRAGNHTIIRHLLSADTKEERNEWSAHLNKALALMRAWGSSK